MSKAKELLDKHLILKGVQRTLIVNGAVYVACRNAIDEALTIHSVSQQRKLLIDFAKTYDNCHQHDTVENTVDWYLRVKDN